LVFDSWLERILIISILVFRFHFGFPSLWQVVSDITDLLGKPNISDFYPGLAQFDLQGIERQMMRLAKRFDRIFEQMIEKKLKMEGEGGKGSLDGGEKSKDFLQFLLELKDEEDAKTPLTMTGLKALLMVSLSSPPYIIGCLLLYTVLFCFSNEHTW